MDASFVLEKKTHFIDYLASAKEKNVSPAFKKTSYPKCKLLSICHSKEKKKKQKIS